MSFFETVTVSAAEAGRSPNLLTQMRAQKINGIIVKQVYDHAICDTVSAHLEAGRHDLLKTDFPAKFSAFFYGINLNLAHPDLREYFTETRRFREGLSRLFPGELDLESRVTRLLSTLDQGCAYAAAPGPHAGNPYMFTTLRAHLPGGYIPPHFDDEQAERPSYRHLMSLIQKKLFSFVLAFSKGEDGGALEIFDLQPAQDGQRIAVGDRSAVRPNLEAAERVSFRLDPGDMIIFNSGRYLHRVTPVIGAKTRWTACSFMAESRSPDQVYCWG